MQLRLKLDMQMEPQQDFSEKKKEQQRNIVQIEFAFWW